MPFLPVPYLTPPPVAQHLGAGAAKYWGGKLSPGTTDPPIRQKYR